MKTRERSGCIDQLFLDLGTRWRWVVSFTLPERVPGSHWLGGSVSSWVGLDAIVKRTFLTPPGLELQPLGRLVRSQSLYRLRYPCSCILKSGCQTPDQEDSVEEYFCRFAMFQLSNVCFPKCIPHRRSRRISWNCKRYKRIFLIWYLYISVWATYFKASDNIISHYYFYLHIFYN
jgi:hypothetical protein